MNWQIHNFFPLLESFPYKNTLFQNGSPPWKALGSIEKVILEYIEEVKDDVSSGEILREVSIQLLRDEDGKILEKMVFVNHTVKLATAVVFRDLGIYIGRGTILEPTAIIKPPALIGNNCEIRQGAYCRGKLILGHYSTIGHTTEIKNSIMMNHSDAGHFAYIGDSIIGSHVNLGAGTKLANLQFRSGEEKEGKKKSGDIRITTEEGALETDLRKLGAVIGDYSELGCNCVTSPGTILGHTCWVYPNTVVAKGVYPSGTMKVGTMIDER